MEPDFSWIYLIIFLIIPLARIIPRFLARRKMKKTADYSQERQRSYYHDQVSSENYNDQSKSETEEMRVLGEITRGTKTFEKIQKNTGIDAKELDKILGNLEKNKMLTVNKKQGLLGPKIELFPTDKGYSKYHS